MLASGASAIFTLNVTNASSGIFQVGVTSISINNPIRFAFINTTTTVIYNTQSSVISNTNNVYVANNTLVSLNSTITDTDLKNATVNVSLINSTINEAVLTLIDEYWVNDSIIADKGDTNGFVNLTITAYDNAGIVNNSINMTVAIDATPPSQPANFTNATEPFINSVYVSWIASWNGSADPNNGSGINHYQIEQTNDSFNYLTVPRDIINASDIRTGYEPDASWFTNWVPSEVVGGVSCTECHALPQHSGVGNFWVKYNQSFLYIIVHVPDNDSTMDDSIQVAFDNVSGATAPQPYDILYDLSEDNILTSYTGNGTAWNASNTTAAAHFVNGTGTHAPRYEIRIPLNEIGNPVNNTVINFYFATTKSNESGFNEITTHYPLFANTINPSTWKTITYRNFTDYVSIANTTSTDYIIQNLIGSYRYSFSVRAIDNVGNIGNRSVPLMLETSEIPTYNVSGYLLNTLGNGVSGLVEITGIVFSVVSSNSDGSYTMFAHPNDTSSLLGRAPGYEPNSTVIITINGTDLFDVNITLTDDTAPTVTSNTNDVIVAKGTAPLLNATITDLGTGVKDATVNVSAINSSINEAILDLNAYGFWTNDSIIADKATSGFVNITITAYDTIPSPHCYIYKER
jgi:hypothetical protein